MHDVFISYSSVNQYMADAICNRLEYGGVKCWYAPRDIAGGEDWPAAIMKAIHSARVFILIYSANSNQSKQVIREVAAAVESECTIVPFRIDETPMCANLAYYLSGVHWMDAMHTTMEQTMENLYTRVWWLIHPPEIPQDSMHQPQRPVPPVPVPQKKKKGKAWLIVLGILLLLGIVGAALFVNWENIGNFAGGATEAQPEAAQVQTISFLNLSQLHTHSYPYYSIWMFSRDYNAYFVEDMETGLVSYVKTDTGHPIITDMENVFDDPLDVYALTADDMDVIYFWDIDQVKIYDKVTCSWVNSQGVSMALDEGEYVETVLTARQTDESLCFLVGDQMGISRAVKIYPDGSREMYDIRHLGLVAHLCSIDKPGWYVTAMWDDQGNIRILDVDTLSVLNLTQEQVREEFLCYNIGDGPINQTGRYLLEASETSTSTVLTVWDLVQQKTVLTKNLTMDYTTCFKGDKTLLLYNEEDCTLTQYDLSTGRAAQLLDAQYFAQNAAFSSEPFSFDYSEKMDVCFFVTAEDVEDHWEVMLIATDLEGNVLAQSQVLNISFANANTLLFVEEGMIFFAVVSDDVENNIEDGVSTIVFRAKYTYNAKGELIFIQ